MKSLLRLAIILIACAGCKSITDKLPPWTNIIRPGTIVTPTTSTTTTTTTTIKPKPALVTNLSGYYDPQLVALSNAAPGEIDPSHGVIPDPPRVLTPAFRFAHWQTYDQAEAINTDTWLVHVKAATWCLPNGTVRTADQNAGWFGLRVAVTNAGKPLWLIIVDKKGEQWRYIVADPSRPATIYPEPQLSASGYRSIPMRQCAWCGETDTRMLDRHHYAMQSRHPELKDNPTNIVVLCDYCHFVMGHRCNTRTENLDLKPIIEKYGK